MNQKKEKEKGAGFILTIFVALFLIIFLIVLTYYFLVRPFKIFGSPIEPFKTNQIVYGEKISYLFNKPKIGDRIIFKPDSSSSDHVGLIISSEEKNNLLSYKVVSAVDKNPWELSEYQITHKIYYPFINDGDIKKIISGLPESVKKEIDPTLQENLSLKSDLNSLPSGNPTPVASLNPSSRPLATGNPTQIPLPSPTSQKKTIQVSISGKIYRDENCDSALEQTESGIPGIEVNIYQNGNIKLTTLSTDANGNYRYAKEIDENETIVLEAQSVAPQGYKINQVLDYSNVNKSAPNVTINLPRIPYESLGNCSMP